MGVFRGVTPLVGGLDRFSGVRTGFRGSGPVFQENRGFGPKTGFPSGFLGKRVFGRFSGFSGISRKTGKRGRKTGFRGPFLGVCGTQKTGNRGFRDPVCVLEGGLPIYNMGVNHANRTGFLRRKWGPENGRLRRKTVRKCRKYTPSLIFLGSAVFRHMLDRFRWDLGVRSGNGGKYPSPRPPPRRRIIRLDGGGFVPIPHTPLPFHIFAENVGP